VNDNLSVIDNLEFQLESTNGCKDASKMYDVVHSF